MPIPEAQLETWSHQGSIAQSSATYHTIKRILEGANTPYSKKNYSVFLQGSYGNDTNIFSESDVDIVIQLSDSWFSDLSLLNQEQQAAYEGAFVDATYTYADFKRDVSTVLAEEFGDDVSQGNKAIAIAGRGNRRKADVIVAMQFRRYFKFNSTRDQSYEEGICFFNAAGERIANYPKQHSARLTCKHQATGNRLKPLIRVLKNLREKLVGDGLLDQSTAPSYYLEGFLYNVPNDRFANDLQGRFVGAIKWFQTEAEKEKLVCANEQYYLLRDNCHTCWPTASCEKYIRTAVELWNSW